MPATVVTSHLDANLAALGERNADMAARIMAVEPAADLDWNTSPDGELTATLGGKPLCSRHRPIEEARRLVADLDVLEHAVFVIIGFGLGYHAQELSSKLGRTGFMVIFESDLPLLRAVFEAMDHSAWLRHTPTVWISDPEDRGALGRKIDGSEAILALGVEFVEHPASRARLGEGGRQFAATFAECIATCRTTLLTTLVRSVDTARNLLLNLDHYAAGPGIADLRDAAAGRLAVVVSAGPSLSRNLHLLKDPAVRDRCVIIAVQTMLKPLLAAGIRPHFITALDYHEISRRFYEGLTAEDVAGVTLVADPKVHPSVIDAFPGPVRCCAAAFLDQILDQARRDMGHLPAGATVAHLCVYLARFLGCNPIALIGQDLGFTDGLYYAPGTAVHDVWATELNPFNTIEMMEWQRIVSHRRHLQKVSDVHGRSIYTDGQMTTYRQQFERDFAQYAKEGLTIIDATEGGVVKQHTQPMALAQVLREFATTAHALAATPTGAGPGRDPARLKAASRRVEQVQREIAVIRKASQDTTVMIQRILDEPPGSPQAAKCFGRIDEHRRTVEKHFAAFELVNQMNQLGVYKRLRADRRLNLSQGLDAHQHQRAQLERDLVNVTWIADACDEMQAMLADSRSTLAGRPGPERSHRGATGRAMMDADRSSATAAPLRVEALVPVDPERNALGIPRSLAASLAGRPVIQATLERLCLAKGLASIVLIVPRGFDIEPLLDRSRLKLPVEIEWCDGSPFGPERSAIAAARLWADSCWRGGLGGMCAADEVLCPAIMHPIMDRRGISAAVLVGPDWPLVDVSAESGIDAIIARHREVPQHYKLVFTQAPPGLGAVLVSAELMADLAQRNRLSTFGTLLSYQPRLPQHDPIARDVNVQIVHRIRRGMIRATFDSPRNGRLIERAITIAELDSASCAPLVVVEALETARSDAIGAENAAESLPRHVILELTTTRQSNGLFNRHPFGRIDRPPISQELARRVIDQLGPAGDVVLTLDGVGDGLLHEQFDRIIVAAKEAGVCGVHLRTELLADRSTLDRLLASGVDVISVDLHADRAATYQAMMGMDRFKEVLLNLDHLAAHRRRLTAHEGSAAWTLPWIVPRLQRRVQTHEDIDSFYDRWVTIFGAAVIESPPSFDDAVNPGSGGGDPRDVPDSLLPTMTPLRVTHHQLMERMMILSDGSVPMRETDLPGRECVGNAVDRPLAELWRDLRLRRWEMIRVGGDPAAAMRTYRP